MDFRPVRPLKMPTHEPRNHGFFERAGEMQKDCWQTVNFPWRARTLLSSATSQVAMAIVAHDGCNESHCTRIAMDGTPLLDNTKTFLALSSTRSFAATIREEHVPRFKSRTFCIVHPIPLGKTITTCPICLAACTNRYAGTPCSRP